MVGHNAAFRTRAFTLIELLVVVAIILVLAGLILGGSAMVQRLARRVQVSQRTQAVEVAIRQATKAHRDGLHALQQAMGLDLRWAPLIEILDDLRDESVWASGYRYAAQQDRCPPYLRHIHNNNLRPPYHTWGVFQWTYPSVPGDLDEDLRVNPIGERPDNTLEVMPPRSLAPNRPTAAWYRERWPTIWPAVDWRTQEGPVLIGSPWGRVALEPNGRVYADGTRLPLHLGQFSPLRSMQLLQFAELLPAGAEGLAAFRQDRQPRQPWNDPFGHPLVLVGAGFVANRLDGWTPGASGQTRRAQRDFLITQARQHYGTARQAYLAVAVSGPVLASPLPAAWAEADDAPTLRALWDQVATLCEAQRWDERGFESRPWKGLATGKAPGGRQSWLVEPWIVE